MRQMREVLIKNEEDTKVFGHRLAESLTENAVVALIGDLGTGKTTLTKYIAEGLALRKRLQALLLRLSANIIPADCLLYHFDVYRLENADDLFEIGAEEYFLCRRRVCHRMGGSGSGNIARRHEMYLH